MPSTARSDASMPTNSTRRGLVSGAATYLVSNVVNAAIPFALLPILTRHLTPHEYGQVAMFQTLLVALTTIVGLNVTGAAGRKFYDAAPRPDELREFLGTCLQILAASAAIALGTMLALLAPLSRWLGLEPRWVIAACVTSAAAFVVQLRMGQWQVRQQHRAYGALQVSQSTVNVSLSLVLVLGLGLGAAGRIGAQVATALTFAALSLALLRRDRLLALAWRPDQAREALRFGAPLVPHAVGVLVLGMLDRFVINDRLGLAEVGVYMVAVQLSSAMGLVFTSFNNAYVPWLFERLTLARDADRSRIVRVTYAYFLLALAAAGLAFVAGPLVVAVVAGPGYRAAGQALGWLALSQAFGGMYLMVTNYVFYSKRTGLLSVVTVGAGLLDAALLVLLVPSRGLVGAAAASAAAMGMRFFLTWALAQRRHPMPWFSFRARRGVDAVG